LIKMSDSSLILMNMDGNIVKQCRFDPFGNLEAVLFKEMLHAAFAYSTGAKYYTLGKKGWKWIIAEDVVAGEKCWNA